jgi:hypothetical protein
VREGYYAPMAYGDSLARVAERQCEALRALEGGLATAVPAVAGDGSWDAREILLHLLGATREMPADLVGGREELISGQTGGQYNDVPELARAAEVLEALVRQLTRIAHVARGVDDPALSRSVSVGDGSGGQVTAPVGLVVRHRLTAHFDEHIAQIREGLTPGTD